MGDNDKVREKAEETRHRHVIVRENNGKRTREAKFSRITAKYINEQMTGKQACD